MATYNLSVDRLITFAQLVDVQPASEADVLHWLDRMGLQPAPDPLTAEAAMSPTVRWWAEAYATRWIQDRRAQYATMTPDAVQRSLNLGTDCALTDYVAMIRATVNDAFQRLLAARQQEAGVMADREYERGPWNIRECLPDGCGWFCFSPSESRQDARFPDQYTAAEIADLARVACQAADLVAVDAAELRAALVKAAWEAAGLEVARNPQHAESVLRACERSADAAIARLTGGQEGHDA